jgi:hypothetical protein
LVAPISTTGHTHAIFPRLRYRNNKTGQTNGLARLEPADRRDAVEIAVERATSA